MLAPSRASPEGSPTPASWAKVGSRSMWEAATWETPLEKARETGVKRRPVTNSWAKWGQCEKKDVIFIFIYKLKEGVTRIQGGRKDIKYWIYS